MSAEPEHAQIRTTPKDFIECMVESVQEYSAKLMAALPIKALQAPDLGPRDYDAAVAYMRRLPAMFRFIRPPPELAQACIALLRYDDHAKGIGRGVNKEELGLLLDLGIVSVEASIDPDTVGTSKPRVLGASIMGVDMGPPDAPKPRRQSKWKK